MGENFDTDQGMNFEHVPLEQVAEHVFPGLKFRTLPLFPHNVKLLLDWYTQARVRREVRMLQAVNSGKIFMERENIEPKQMTLRAVLIDAVPNGITEHPVMYDNVSFVDMLQSKVGERLAGVAIRILDYEQRYYTPLGNNLIPSIGPKKYSDKPETLIGVVDREGKPKAIIHYIKGAQSGIRAEASHRAALVPELKQG